MTVLLFLSAIAVADPAPVETTLTPTADAWAGQKQTLVVLVRVPTYFAGPTSFDLPSIPGVVLIPPSGSPVIGNETIDGNSYTTQRHEIAVYPVRAGLVSIPSFPVRFSQAGVGAQPAMARREMTRPVELTARMPPGAGKLASLVTTPELTMTETWTPEPGTTAKVGDAFTRRVAVRARDVPGLAIPPLRLANVEGLAAYPKPADVADHTDRGTLTGERTESIVYVCEQTGTAAIPERTLSWWNPDEKKLNRAKLQERGFEIVASATAPAELVATHTSRTWLPWAIGSVMILALGSFLARRRRLGQIRAAIARGSSILQRWGVVIRSEIAVGQLVSLNPPDDRRTSRPL